MENVEIRKMMEAYLQEPSEEKKQELVGATAVYVFTSLKCILGKAYPADEDARSEFILWIYPQLERIVDRFDPEKASFLTYVSVGVKYRYIRFCMEKAKAAEIRRAAENEETKFCEGYNIEDQDEELCVCESSAPYGAASELQEKDAAVLPCVLERAGKSESAKKRMSRDILLLALKSTFYLSEDLIEKVSVFCEIPREDLESLLESVRRDYSARQGVYEELRLRKYCYYIRAFSCRKKLSDIQLGGASDSEKIRAMEKERDFCDKQNARLCSKMQKLQRNPSNRYLAGLLGMPRGSVNSALVRMKKHLYSSDYGDTAGDF